MEDNHIPALGGAFVVGDFVSKDILLVLEAGDHGPAVDFVRLKQKQVYHHEDGKSHDYWLQGIQDPSHTLQLCRTYD